MKTLVTFEASDVFALLNVLERVRALLKRKRQHKVASEVSNTITLINKALEGENHETDKTCSVRHLPE